MLNLHQAHSPNILERCSYSINSRMEDFFGYMGWLVAGSPRLVLSIAVSFTLVSFYGFSEFVMIR